MPEAGVVFCPSCGLDVGNSAAYCPSCQSPLPEPRSGDSADPFGDWPDPAAAGEPTEDPVTGARPRRTLVAAAVAISLIALVRWGPSLGDGIIDTFAELQLDPAGLVGEAGSISAFAIRAGDCFDLDDGITTSVERVELVSCPEAHTFEAYATYVYPEGDHAEYPGEQAIWAFSDEFCLAGFEAFVGRRYETSALDFAYLYPEEEGWQQGDRTVLCIIQSVEGSPLVGTMEGSGL